MPMIDVYAAAGTFADKRPWIAPRVHMKWEAVPPRALRDNTATFVHDLPADRRHANGATDHVRVQVLTPRGARRPRQAAGVVRTPTSSSRRRETRAGVRTWVLLTSRPRAAGGGGTHRVPTSRGARGIARAEPRASLATVASESTPPSSPPTVIAHRRVTRFDA